MILRATVLFFLIVSARLKAPLCGMLEIGRVRQKGSFHRLSRLAALHGSFSAFHTETLHSVLVQSAEGPYYAFIRPTGDTYFKFDDEQVTKEHGTQLLENMHGSNNLNAQSKTSNVEKLVYVRQSEWTTIMKDIPHDSIPVAVHQRQADIAAGRLYLQSMPALLQDSTDTVLMVQDTRLPVHGLLVAMQSWVLAEALACNSGTGLRNEIHLAGDTIKTIQHALAYMYRCATARPAEGADFSSWDEAVGVARFAHKYDAMALASEAEAFLHQHVQGMARWQPAKQQRLQDNHREATKEALELAATENAAHWDMMDMLAFASQVHFEKLEWLCLQKLVHMQGTRRLRSDARLELLQPEVLGKLMQKLAL